MNQSQDSSHQTQIAPQDPPQHSPSGTWDQLFRVNTQITPVRCSYTTSCQLLNTQATLRWCREFPGNACGLGLAWLLSPTRPDSHTSAHSWVPNRLQLEPDAPALGSRSKRGTLMPPSPRGLCSHCRGPTNSGPQRSIWRNTHLLQMQQGPEVSGSKTDQGLANPSEGVQGEREPSPARPQSQTPVPQPAPGTSCPPLNIH